MGSGSASKWKLGSGSPHQNEKLDPDRHRNGKSDPYRHQSGKSVPDRHQNGKSDSDLGIKMKSQIRIVINMKSRIRNLLLTCGGGDGQSGAGQGHHPVPHTSSQLTSKTPPPLLLSKHTHKMHFFFSTLQKPSTELCSLSRQKKAH